MGAYTSQHVMECTPATAHLDLKEDSPSQYLLCCCELVESRPSLSLHRNPGITDTRATLAGFYMEAGV